MFVEVADSEHVAAARSENDRSREATSAVSREGGPVHIRAGEVGAVASERVAD